MEDAFFRDHVDGSPEVISVGSRLASYRRTSIGDKNFVTENGIIDRVVDNPRLRDSRNLSAYICLKLSLKLALKRARRKSTGCLCNCSIRRLHFRGFRNESHLVARRQIPDDRGRSAESDRAQIFESINKEFHRVRKSAEERDCRHLRASRRAKEVIANRRECGYLLFQIASKRRSDRTRRREERAERHDK